MVKKTIKSKGSKLLKSAKKNIKSKKTAIVIGLIIVLVVLAVSFNMNRFSTKDVAASVNGEKITFAELEKEYSLVFFINGFPEEYKQVITKEAMLDQLINEKLLLEEASANDIVISNEELTIGISDLLINSKVNETEFAARLIESGFTMEEFSSYFKKQMTISQHLDVVFESLEIDDEELKEYYDSNIAKYSAQEGQIRLRHILVETEKEANDILKSLKLGKDFVKLAKEKSIGPSGPNGGELGFVNKGQMVPEFEKAAFKLNINQLSPVVETQFGFHVIKRESGKLSFDDVKSNIVETLSSEKQQALLQDYLKELRSEAVIVNNLDSSVNPEQELEKVVGEVVLDSSCYANTNLTANTVIFYHADWCPHCKKMVPIVEELESEGYSFHVAESTSGEGVEVVEDCFRDVLQGGIPQFICVGSKEYVMGEMSKSQLKAFADNCQ